MPQTVPTSTYRLQINADFTLDDAAALTDYLRELGVGAVYCSPLLRSTSGSDHGYDTVDPTELDPARGGDEGWARLVAAAAEQDLDLVVDIVPNHLGVEKAEENPAWWDVLRLGAESPYARWFDIDWTRTPLLLPVLGPDPVLEVVADGLNGQGELRYYEHRFPLAPGTWSAGDDPDEVHERQHYRLVSFRRGDTELGYRRFFAVTTLAGVRVEDPAVFDATHARIRGLVADGVVGLRVDHPDGLADPGAYLQRLRDLAPDAWITVEKILEPGEELPASWPVAGTTGYDAMFEVDGVFTDDDTEPELTALYRRLTSDEQEISDHIETGKQRVVDVLLPAELRRMAALAPDVPEAGPALAELAVAFDVYRSYVPEISTSLDRSLAETRRRHPHLAEALDRLAPRLHDADDELAVRMQQLSGATMAKGVEDTAFYRYGRFVAANEVGGDPAHVGLSVDAFHTAQAERAEGWPTSMTGLSTHDTKRGEDVRARMAVLSEVPARWAVFAEAFCTSAGVPDARFAYFLAQNLVGVGPAERDRVHAYAEKAMREAAEHTGYVDPDETYEAAVHAAVDRAYDDPTLRGAWDELVAFVTPHGWSNALGKKLVQLTMPGVPDVYQGTEVWEDSLVDPDNRRPVDFAQHRRLLAGLDSAPPVDASGRAKLWVTRQALRARRDRPELFTGYAPVPADGRHTNHLVAFDRGGAVTLATRLSVGLAGHGWGDATVDLPGDLVDVLSGRPFGGTVPVAEVLSAYPVALLLPADARRAGSREL
ncbi:MAG TPA: malto-oligosyltrehalose synthase [Friedmanniella sp.]